MVDRAKHAGLEMRYFPRPAEDPHARERPFFDPVFAVWGGKQTVA